ncbi:MAG: toxin-antitoxin system HicB family antitoxin [Gammaproteobacteria bacterium]|nr:MAG: toxin-antitoxin system HicB family antitoxin [Gammaproteobacteria bacterium]
MLNYKGYSAVIDYDEVDKILIGRVAGINAIVGFHAKTSDELELKFKQSIEHYLATCLKLKQQPETAFSGKFVIRMEPELHAKISHLAAQQNKSLNSYAVDVIRKRAL